MASTPTSILLKSSEIHERYHYVCVWVSLIDLKTAIASLRVNSPEDIKCVMDTVYKELSESDPKKPEEVGWHGGLCLYFAARYILYNEPIPHMNWQKTKNQDILSNGIERMLNNT